MWACTQKTRDSCKTSDLWGLCKNLNLQLGKTSRDEYVRKLGSKHAAREIEVETQVDLVRNESDHPPEEGSSLDGPPIKRPLSKASAPSKLLQTTFYLLLWSRK